MKKTAYTPEQIKMLNLLSKQYPSIQTAGAAVVNLNAILNLPKGTEHFLSDLHGEAEAFKHILNNCSGVIREKVDNLFYRFVSESERRELCTLIYYPAEKIEELHAKGEDSPEWYDLTLYRLVDLARSVASKYTRSKVRDALPSEYQNIIDELLHTSGEEHNKQEYYRNIISTIIEIGQAPAFVEALCSLIKRMAVDCLHVVGDIYDRGQRADKILDMLMAHHNVDVQWGNHDIVWMGAAAGSPACVASVLNLAVQYNTLSLVENSYGISLRDLIGFAQETYGDCSGFMPRSAEDKDYIKNNMSSLSKAHKAIAIILFKLEGQLIMRHPEYEMEGRLLLDKIDRDKKAVTIEGVEYPLDDYDFPTIDINNPYALSPEEEGLMASLTRAFKHSAALQAHVKFLYAKGSLYKIYNQNLLFHGCIPMAEDGNFQEVKLYDGRSVSGKEYMDSCDRIARLAYYNHDKNALDFMYYLWCGKRSPLFGREKMTTFERCFISDKSVWTEKKNPYYSFIDNYDAICKILHEFGLNERSSHVINGHVPVKAGAGENPVKANGRYILIDGGFCKAYHTTTGIAGYTLIYSSRGLRLVSHGAFEGKAAAIKENKDILATTDVVFEMMNRRMMVADTDEGKELIDRKSDLKDLLDAYRTGMIKPNEQI